MKGTNEILWTCLGLSLIASLTVFVLMFLLRKMNSEPSKDECKNTGWFDGQSLKSISKRLLLWISVPSLSLSLFLCWLFHLVRALLSVLEDSCVKWTFGKERAVFFLVCLFFAGAPQSHAPPHSSLSNYSLEVVSFLGKHPPLWPKLAHWLNVLLSETASQVCYY